MSRELGRFRSERNHQPSLWRFPLFPSLFGHPNSPLTQRCLGPVLQQLDGLLTTPRAPQELLQPRPIRRRQRLYPLAVTLKMSLTPCLSDDPSCRTAVATAKERGWLP
jgi:hypothetical protein